MKRLGYSKFYSIAFLSIFFSHCLSATVGPVVPGQSLWGISKRIGETVDIIESKICELDISGLDGVASQLDVIESKIDTLTSCGLTELTTDSIVTGTITLTASGNYCLAEDITANITISGDCISLDLNRRCVNGTVSLSGDDIELKNGNLVPGAAIGESTTTVEVSSTSNRIRVIDVQIRNDGSVTTEGLDGRDGISNRGTNTQILGCTILAGDGASATTIGGGSGGDGIVVSTDAIETVIRNCLISSGAGGTTTNATSPGGPGGAGISVASDATQTEISECTVLSTGDGGNGGAGSGTGGDGGNGIDVASTCIDTQIRNCTIRNTGSGGSGGGGAGAGGKAIDDDVTIVANLTMAYTNFAHNIANSIKFDLQATGIEQGVAIPNPPTATVINSFANVYAS